MLSLDDIVLENGLGVEQILLLLGPHLGLLGVFFRILIIVSVIVLFVLGAIFVVLGGVWRQNDHLLGFHEVHTVVRLLSEGASLDEVDLLKELELLPLLV